MQFLCSTFVYIFIYEVFCFTTYIPFMNWYNLILICRKDKYLPTFTYLLWVTQKTHHSVYSTFFFISHIYLLIFTDSLPWSKNEPSLKYIFSFTIFKDFSIYTSCHFFFKFTFNLKRPCSFFEISIYIIRE